MDFVCKSRGHSCGRCPAIAPPEGGYPSIYRPRNPRASSLYQLFDSLYETVKGLWEERFERRYGF